MTTSYDVDASGTAPATGGPRLPLTYDVTLTEEGIRKMSLAGSMISHPPVVLVVLVLCSVCTAVSGHVWFAVLIWAVYAAGRALSFLRTQKVFKQRLLETQGVAEMRYRITIDEDGVRCLNLLSDWHADFGWADIARVGRTKDLWVLKTRGYQLIPVPKSAVPDVAWLKQLIADNQMKR